MPTKETLLAELSNQTYAAVPFPQSHREIETAVAAFFGFLSLPEEEKNALRFKRETDKVSDVGYVRTAGEKGEDDGKRDFKEYFHYHPDAKERFHEEASREPRLAAFLTAADRLFQDAEDTLQAVIRELDREYPGLYGEFCPPHAPLERILRFLKYDNRGGEGDFLARGHYDRGGCTLAIAESAPGLRIGKDDATLTPVVHKDGTAIFFAAPQLADLTGQSIRAAWHDVVQASGDTVSKDAARWAVVYFVNAPGHAFPSSKETHTVKK